MVARNIVLLSDGTGNSSSKIIKSNVWRIFEAIDLEKGDQLAFFDDGVGTGGSKILRALGGALGFGLARNVRQLYGELCRHYTGPEDQIMLFGFSRGAFTVRVLSGLIDHCGVIDRARNNTTKVWRWSKFRNEDVPLSTDEGLERAIRVAYRSLRMRGHAPWPSRVYRWVRDLFAKTPEARKFRDEFSVAPHPRIAFLGVFDTVSAYGLPIDEMTIAIHKHLFRLRFPDMILSRKVDNAVQALALDEARQSFHPVLWTERIPGPAGASEPDLRPMQAWFAGVHSDIGGGYSNERLSLVPAIWMLEEAERLAELRLRVSALDDLRQRATQRGEIHDSRQGLGSFYRYKPRMLARLGHEDLDGNGYAEVEIDRFKIHESVFERIRETKADYAPLGIPEDYAVVRRTIDPDGPVGQEIVPAAAAGLETDTDRARRVELMRGVEKAVFGRRAAYFVMTGVALVLAVVPFLWLTNPAEIGDGPVASLSGPISSLAGYLPIPGGERIARFWEQNWTWFAAFAALYLATYLVSASLARKIQATAQAAWAHVAAGTAPAVSPRPAVSPASAVSSPPQRVETRGSWLHRVWTKQVFPVLLLVLIFGVVPAIFIWRWYMFLPVGGESICSYLHDKELHAPAAADNPVSFSTSNPCLATGIELKEGRIYALEITIGEPWSDREYAADPSGLAWDKMEWGPRLEMAALSLTRRVWTEDWFGLMGSIGRSRDYIFRIDAKPDPMRPNVYVYRFLAWRSGNLYLFVNDAINAFGSERLCGGPMDANEPWRCYYDNNIGTATIKLTEVSEL